MTQDDQAAQRKAIDDAVREFEDNTQHAINREVAEMGQRVIMAAVKEMARRLRSTADHEHQLDALKKENEKLRAELAVIVGQRDRALSAGLHLTARLAILCGDDQATAVLDAAQKDIDAAKAPA